MYNYVLEHKTKCCYYCGSSVIPVACVSLQELDEINQQLTFSALMLLEWDDANLAWDTASYNNTVYMSYPQKDVWIPDITIMNSMESMKELGFDRNYL